MAPAAARPGPLAAGLGFVLLSFALNSVMTRLLVARGLLDPGLTTTARFLAGAASLALLLALLRRPGALRPRRANLAPAAWLGAYAVLISYGYLHIGAAAGTFVFYACVLGTMVGAARLQEGRRTAPAAAAGALLALAGVGVLAAGRAEGTTLLGVALLAGTGVSWGAYSVLGRGMAGDPLGFTAANFAALALVLPAPAALLASGALGPAPATAEGLGLAVFMGAVTTALSYAVWYWALARITRAQGATYQLAIPVVTAALAVALLGEAPTLELGLAGALVLAGMALAARGRGPGLGTAKP